MNAELVGSQDKLMRVRNEYLDLMQAFLTGSIYRDFAQAPFGSNLFDSHRREHGLDWPSSAETMIGVKRLANLRALTESVIADNVPGDLIETGVWRGGACILMRAILYASSVSDKSVWVADSFEGLPAGNTLQYPADAGSDFHTYSQLAVSLDEVKENFRVHGLLDAQVKFLKGWFKDSLPKAPIDRLALLRLDGDMYESTMDALTYLYPKLSRLGYVIVDDYHVVPACKAAVSDYCEKNAIRPQIVEIDGVGVYWRKSSVPEGQSEIVSTNEVVASFDVQIARLDQAVLELSKRAIAQLNRCLSERDELIASMTQSLAEQDRQIVNLKQTLVQRDEYIAALLSSASWRVTEPLRVMGALLRKFHPLGHTNLKGREK